MKLSRYISLRLMGSALLISFASIIVSYITIQRIMERNVDESLEAQQIWLQPLLQTKNPDTINLYNPMISVDQVANVVREQNRFYTKNVYIPFDDEFVNYRILDYYRNVNGRYYYISIKKSLLEHEDILYSIVGLQLGVFLLLLLTLIFINKQLKISVWNSFYAIIHRIKRYRVDQKYIDHLPSSTITELQDLSFSVDNLMKTNLRLFNAQKELTENTSHELQTPLAIFQNKLDLLMQTQPLSKQQMQYILDLQRTSRKMSQLNKGLLLLAKIENNQYLETKTISIKEALIGVVKDFNEALLSKDLKINIEISEDKVLNVNQTLIQIALNNLISNAAKFSPKGSVIYINLSVCILLISNTSISGPLQETSLFQRFRKQNKDNNGNGLGLEIVQKIVNIYGWKLVYLYKDDQHCFKLTFC